MTRSKPLKTVKLARRLRRNLSPPEVLLWQILRARPEGIRFRRQHPFGPYVIDFYCAEARLAIELDGIVHDMGDSPTRDAVRDAWLMEQGVAVVRNAAADVMNDASAVADTLLRAVLDLR